MNPVLALLENNIFDKEVKDVLIVLDSDLEPIEMDAIKLACEYNGFRIFDPNNSYGGRQYSTTTKMYLVTNNIHKYKGKKLHNNTVAMNYAGFIQTVTHYPKSL